MLDPLLRPVKDAMLTPVAARLRQVSPNAITVVSSLTGLAAAALLLLPSYALALVVWVISRLLDGLDGAVARASGRSSDFGGYIDIVGDFVVYAAVPIGLVIGRGGGRGELIALCVLLASFYVNAASWMYLSAILEKRRAGAAVRGDMTSVAMPDALIGGTETLVLFSLMFVVPHHAAALFAGMSLLVVISTVQRVTWAFLHVR